ncbi:unnamed protein product [Trichobilharzia szidati]|nr:unnamed protein product [Trichobilharzia szidati]
MEQKEEKTQPSGISVEVAQEYSAKLLGFEPLQLSDDLYNAILTCIGQLVDTFCEEIMEKFAPRFAGGKIQSLNYHLKEKLEHRLSKMFDTFDTFLVGNVLHLSPLVVLKDDEPQLTYSQKADEIAEEHIERHINRIKIFKRSLTRIKEETAEIKSFIENIREMKDNVNQTIEKVYGFKSGATERESLKD